MLSFFMAAALPAAAFAHDHALWARQVQSSASSSGSSVAVPSSVIPSGVFTSGTATTPATPTPSPVSVSLLSTNPTAIPLSSITASVTGRPTTTFSTPSAGATPTYMKGAPPLPNVANIHPSSYPALDVIPPTDSPEVQQWIAEVAASGRTIPNITQTVAGGCAANLAAVNDDANRCWWTCGGCTRDTDITTCPNKLTWGLTYDDGPAPYTPNLLQYLDSQNLKATFFVVGSRCISYPALLQSEYLAGHQISVHTWSHHYLTQMTNDQIIAELGWSRKIIKDVLGVTPNTFRPPFGDMDDRVRAIALALGLTPIIWTRISKLATFDTDDFSINGGLTTANQVLANWENIIGNATTINTGFIVLEHDLFPQSVDIATGYILPDALARNPKFDIKPVVQCLNKPLSDAYVETNDNKTNPTGSQAATLSASAPGSLQGTGGSSGASASASSGANGAVPIGHSTFVATAVLAAFGIGAVML